jgi:hypothetical protein
MVEEKEMSGYHRQQSCNEARKQATHPGRHEDRQEEDLQRRFSRAQHGPQGPAQKERHDDSRDRHERPAPAEA